MTVFLFHSSAVALGEKAKPRSAKPNTVGAAFKNFIRSPYWCPKLRCSKLSEPFLSLRTSGVRHAGVRLEPASQRASKTPLGVRGSPYAGRDYVPSVKGIHCSPGRDLTLRGA